jgi:hypothetical protein
MTRNIGLVLSVFVVGAVATLVGQRQERPTVDVYKSDLRLLQQMGGASAGEWIYGSHNQP